VPPFEPPDLSGDERFLTRAGALQTAPILVAVVTAYLVVHGAVSLRTGHRRFRG
jgi:hypothetical protein